MCAQLIKTRLKAGKEDELERLFRLGGCHHVSSRLRCPRTPVRGMGGE